MNTKNIWERLSSGDPVDMTEPDYREAVGELRRCEKLNFEINRLPPDAPEKRRLQNELLDPLIEITFDQMMDAGILPPPPPELQGSDINVELVGILAQAQRAIGVNSVDRFVAHIGNLAAARQDPSVWDNYDSDKDVEIYGDMLGVSPELVLSPDKRDAIRQARAEEMAAQQKAMAMNQAADTANKLAGAKTDGPNALTDATALFSGYTQ